MCLSYESFTATPHSMQFVGWETSGTIRFTLGYDMSSLRD